MSAARNLLIVLDMLNDAELRRPTGGSVALNSSDPFDFPLIDPAFLKHPVDAFVAVEAIKSARRFLAAPAWKDYVIGQFGVGGLAKTDAEIEEFARNQTSTVFHPVGTASMSAVDSKSGGACLDFSIFFLSVR